MLPTLFAAVLAVASPPSAGAVNVVFIVADDLNVELGTYGSPIVHTPSIDRLAARGVRFDRAYSQFPVCNPSRASFLSGRRPETTGVLNNTTDPRKRLAGVTLLPEHFQKHGYKTIGMGKIAHDTFPESVSWDVYEAAYGAKQVEPKGWGIARAKEAELPDARLAQRAARLIEEFAGLRFLLAVGFSRPHTPLVAPARYFELYPADRMALPRQAPELLALIPRTALPRDPSFRDLTPAGARQARAAYFASVSFLDAQVGVILDALDRLQLWERTVVVLTSDHGFLLGEHGGWGKHGLFERIVRVPLIVAAPGAKAGVSSPRLVELVDLFPTLASLARLPLPDGLEGASFAPLLAQPERPWKRAAFSSDQRGQPAASVRTERYRYTRWPRREQELYDYDRDPDENRNLAADPAQAGIITEMRKVLEAGWRASRP
jgi:iduronate 2-sulfatase